MVMVFFVLYLVLIFVLFTLLVPVTTLLHELGHAIPLMLMTRRGTTVFVGSYGYEGKGVSVKLGMLTIWIGYNPKRWLRGCCHIPYGEISRLQLFVMISSGPLCTLIVSLALSYMTFQYDMHGFLKLVCILAVFWGIIDLIRNLRPRVFTTQGGAVHYTDGYILFHLKKHHAYFQSVDKAYALLSKEEYESAGNEYKRIIAAGYDNEKIYRLAIDTFLLLKDNETAYPLQLAFEKKYKQTADDYYNLGYSCLILKKEEKTDYFRKTLDIDGNHAHALNATGYILTVQRRFADAMPYLDKAIAMNPELGYAYNNRGHAKIELGEPEAGLQDIEYSLTLDDKNAYAYRNLGIYHLAKGDKEAAQPFLQKAKEMETDIDLIDELLAKAQWQLTI